LSIDRNPSNTHPAIREGEAFRPWDDQDIGSEFIQMLLEISSFIIRVMEMRATTVVIPMVNRDEEKTFPFAS